MLDILMRFVIGLTISLGFGWLVTMVAHEYLGFQIRKKLAATDVDNPVAPSEDAHLFGSQMPLTGTIERLVFTMIVAYNVSGAAIAMMVWLGLKMATGWNENIKTPSGKIPAIHSLFTGMVSLLFALIGGLFISAGFR